MTAGTMKATVSFSLSISFRITSGSTSFRITFLQP